METVIRRLRGRGVVVDNNARNRARVPKAKRNAMETLYLAGNSLAEVAEQLGATVQVVTDELDRRGVTKRGPGRKSRFADKPKEAEEIAAAYKNGCSESLLAEIFKCSRDAIRQVARDAGIEIRKGRAGQQVYRYEDRKGREHWMRSSWEIKTALYFDKQDINWDFELESFEIGPCRRYTPDFWIYAADASLELLVDVKGWIYPASDDRIKLFRAARPDLPFELWGQKELSEKGILDLEMPIPEAKRGKGLRSRISKTEIQEAIKLYESGMTTHQVAARLNRSESAIARHLQKLGKTRSRSQTKRMLSADQAMRDRMAELYLEGNSYSKVAELLDIGRDIIAGEIKHRGIARSGSR
jgi:transposase